MLASLTHQFCQAKIILLYFREQRVVFLSAKGRQWAQYTYQFAHELCHLTIPNKVAANIRWFEEAICDLASHYFLKMAEEQWRNNPPYPNWREYSPSFGEYSKIMMKTATEIPRGVSFSGFINISLSELTQDPYKREMNTLCAKHLLRAFDEYPGLWKDVPKLCKIPSELPFHESLHVWKSLSSEKQAIEKVIALLSSD